MSCNTFLLLSGKLKTVGLFAPECVHRVKFGENGPTVSKVENCRRKSK